MLTSFSVQNFKGFAQRIDFNLNNPGNYAFHQDYISDGIVKCGVIYGPNGSGKTNLSLAIFDIVRHLTQCYVNPDKYVPGLYLTVGSSKNTAEFEYTFKFGQNTIVYKYSKTDTNFLVCEYLSCNNVRVFEKDGAGLYINKDIYSINDVAKANLINSANGVSIVNYILNSCPVSDDDCLFQMKQFVEGMLWYRCLEERSFVGLESNPTSVDAFILENGLTDDFADFLMRMSGQRFKFLKSIDAEKRLMCVINGKVAPFFPVASTGTHSLHLLYYWLKKIEKATFVFVDEFDAFYHHDLAVAVCKELFGHKMQAFLSTHNTTIMNTDYLRPDTCFLLVDNQIKALKDCTSKELRYGHNLEKLYRGGAFSVNE